MMFHIDYPLHAASDEGDLAKVSELLQSGIAVDVLGPNGRSSLHYAARSGHVDVVRVLLESGASPHLLTSDGETALHMATSDSWHARLNPAVVGLLIDAGSDVEQADLTNGWTPLYSCAVFDSGHSEAVEAAALLIRRGATVDGRTSFGDTALHRAVVGARLPMVRFLVDNGADPNIPSSTFDGDSAIQIAERQASGEERLGDWSNEGIAAAIVKCLRDVAPAPQERPEGSSESLEERVPQASLRKWWESFKAALGLNSDPLAEWVMCVIRDPEIDSKGFVRTDMLPNVYRELLRAASERGSLSIIGSTFNLSASARCRCGTIMLGKYLAFLSTATSADVIVADPKVLGRILKNRCPSCGSRTWTLEWSGFAHKYAIDHRLT